MTPHEAFQTGFLYRCSQLGIDPDAAARALMAKEAAGPAAAAATGLSAIPGMVWPVAKAVGSGALSLATSPTAWWMAAGLPIAVGLGGGYMASRLFDEDTGASYEMAKKEELLNEYRRLAEHARRIREEEAAARR